MSFSGNIWLLVLVFMPIVGAFVSYFIGRKNKNLRDLFGMVLVFVVLVATVILTYGGDTYFLWDGFMGFNIHFAIGGFRSMYAIITAFMWLMTTLFSKEYFAHYRNRNRYHFFSLLTFGATLGVFLSADLITTFIFFEIMSLASYVLVIHDEKPRTLEAAKTYMAVAIIGGLALLFGLFIVQNQLHTTKIAELYDAALNFQGNMGILYIAAGFMLIGFGGKAGMYPLHIWLPNAHPVAPAPASALLSGVLTKTGIYGIIIVSTIMFNNNFSWSFAMLNIGLIGMFTGAMLALFATDLKRTLAYSSVSQIGFIILGIGMTGILDPYYSSMPIQGSMLHMLNHSLIKLLLFMAAGVVYINVHELDLNRVRGFGRGKPLFTFVFLMGVLTIIGMPFWSGYVSKTLLHESLVYHIWHYYDYSGWSVYFQTIEGVFTLTGGLTTAYMIKLFICLCVEKNQFNQKNLTKLNKKYITKLTAFVLLVCALVLPALGLLPHLFMIPLGTSVQSFMLRTYDPYYVDFLAWINVRGALTSLVIGSILYILVVRIVLTKVDEQGRRIYINAWPAFLDIEQRIYRPLLLVVLPFIGALFSRTIGSLLPFVSALLYKCFAKFKNFWLKEIENQKEEVSLIEKVNELLNYSFLSVVFSSLVYSLLVFFIGFLIVQIMVFL